MKRFLVVVGSISLGLLVLIVIGITVVFVRGNALDRGSLEYVDEAVPAICSQWDEQALLDRASPELKRVVSTEQVDHLFRWLKTLGPLQKSDPPQGQSKAAFSVNKGAQVTAAYTVKVQFEKGEGTITLGLIKHENVWQIAGFNVQSLALAPP